MSMCAQLGLVIHDPALSIWEAEQHYHHESKAFMDCSEIERIREELKEKRRKVKKKTKFSVLQNFSK